MTYEEAIKILHPDTLRGALAEIEYYNGFSGVEVAAKAIEDACLLACEAMEKQQAMTWRVVGYNEEDGWLYNLPEDGEEILVSHNGYISADVFEDGGEDGCFLESGNYVDEGMAWMPFPEPYKREK